MIKVVAFDVIETLFSLEPVRARMVETGLSPHALPLWFASLLRDAFALDAAGTYVPFKEVAQATLRVMMTNQGVEPTEAKVSRVVAAFAELPAHPDVRPAFEAAQAAGARIVTLTNGSADNTELLLKRAGLAEYVEMTISIDQVKRWKPTSAVYLHAAERTRVEPASLALVAAHAWDVHGAKRAGLQTGWVVRSDQTLSPIAAAPDATGHSLTEVVGRLLKAAAS